MKPSIAQDPVLRVPKAAELVADRIRGQIVRGDLGDGEPLPAERDLIEEYGVSRPTMREAMRLLEADGLVYMQRGRGGGARVAAPTGRAAALHVGLMLEHRRVPVGDLVDAVNSIQVTAAETLARQRTRRDLKALRANIRAGAACLDDPDALIGVTTDFHVELVHRAGNQSLAFFHSILTYVITETVQRGSDPDPRRWGRLAPAVGHGHHEQMVELIEAQDVEGSDRLWREHLAECRSFALSAAGAKTPVDVLSGTRR